MKKQIRFISLILCFIMTAGILCSCAPRPLAHSGIAAEVIGTIKGGSEEYEVCYEELYPHAKDYYESAKLKYGSDTEAIKNEVWQTLKSKLVLNYAALELCKDAGIEYDESELHDRVNDFIQTAADDAYEGDFSKFIEENEKSGYTDHYIRFTAGVNLLYGEDLVLEYQKSGIIPNTDEAMRAYIEKNFLHTWHLTRYVDADESYEAEYARMEEALEELRVGTSMYYLIKDGYTENTDFPLLSGDTYGDLFHKDVFTVEKEVADAAIKLNDNEVSEIIIAKGVSTKSQKTVDCFYIVQRLPLTDSDIENNFEYLSDLSKNAIVAKALDEKIKALTFEPNEFALGLDFANLEAPENGIDYQLVIGICVSVGAVVILVSLIFVFRALRAKKFQKNLKKSKEKKALNKK